MSGYLPPGCTQRECDEAQPGHWDEPDDNPLPKNVVTTYWAKPIPIRDFDWVATFDNYETGCPVGYGRTEADAVYDLMEMAS